ncbi:MAG: hypothetical protein J7K65_10595, partial [Planctomycetes bacterium]|nr:hypothetical protein [Planctomycetota bacterium]
ATLRLSQAGYGLCPGLVSQSQASPISSRALPGTQQIAGDGLGKAVPFLKSSIYPIVFTFSTGFSLIVAQPLSFALPVNDMKN